MADTVVDFDSIDDWAPELGDVLHPVVTDMVRRKLAAAEPAEPREARRLLFELADRDAIIDATLAWIRSITVSGYHGTRLTDAEVASVRANGLLPLDGAQRRYRLVEALSLGSRWNEVCHKLDDTIRAFGPGGRNSVREGQVHLTLSRAGLTNSFDHYLSYGSEFDQNVVAELLGQSGLELLKRYGKRRLIVVSIPGEDALVASHPWSGIDHERERNGVPHLVRPVLEAWAHRLCHPGFQSRTMKADEGLVFRSVVPPAWITEIETLSD
jgi:hypothetical protein